MFQKNETSFNIILNIVKILGFLTILIVLGSALLYTQNLAIFAILTMMFLSLAIPIYTNNNRFASVKGYNLNILAPVLGIYVSLLFWMINIGINFSNPVTILLTSISSGISIFVVIVIHHYTCQMSVVNIFKIRFEKNSFIHSSGNIIAVIVLGAFITFNVSDIFVVDIGNIALLVLILGLYAFSSTFSVNSAYRRHRLHINLKTENVSKKIKILKEILLWRFPKKSNEINFLVYLLERMTASFISGDFERCFIDAITIIKDVTVVKSTKPYRKKILSKKQWNKFRIIRAALVHSEIEEEDENGKITKRVLSEEEVMDIKSHLYQNCIDIQNVVFEVVSLFCLEKKGK